VTKLLTATVLRTESTNVKIALVSIDELKPHEKGSPLYLELLKQEVLKDGLLKYPVISDEETHVILDGMHRWLVLKSLGYKYVPTTLVNPSERSKIHVGRRRIHRYQTGFNGEISFSEVISTGLSGRLMQPRSTRHFFPFSTLQLINYPLRLLEKGPPSDVSPYLAKMSEQECNEAMRGWLSEITEELEYLERRKTEVEKEREGFLKRVRSLEVSYHTSRSFKV
jgi:hypothetical protein